MMNCVLVEVEILIEHIQKNTEKGGVVGKTWEMLISEIIKRYKYSFYCLRRNSDLKENKLEWNIEEKWNDCCPLSTE